MCFYSIDVQIKRFAFIYNLSFSKADRRLSTSQSLHHSRRFRFRARREGIYRSRSRRSCLIAVENLRNVGEAPSCNGRNHTRTSQLHHTRNAPSRSHQDPHPLRRRPQNILSRYASPAPNAWLPATFPPHAYDNIPDPPRQDTIQLSNQLL